MILPVALGLALLCVAPARAQTSRPAASQPASTTSAPEANPAAPGFLADESDARAIEIADGVMQRMGGHDAWTQTRYVRWTFFGRRHHLWDKHTNRVRIDARVRGDDTPYVVVLDINTGVGRVWLDGEELEDGEERTTMLRRGLSAWINDSYWLVMPYKLKDTGVRLRHLGTSDMEDGRKSEVLELTFEKVGDTPGNKYHVHVARDTGLVEQWDFYQTRDASEAGFKVPWKNWTRHGRILLSGDRGRMQLTNVAVYDALPDSAFTDPASIDWDAIPAAPKAEPSTTSPSAP